MDNHTVVPLKVIAKERGMRCYYKLRKAELIHALKTARLVEQTSNIFYQSIPNDPTPVLKPTHLRPSIIAMKDKQNMKNDIAKSMHKIKEFGNWLLDYIPPKPKVVDESLKSFKNLLKTV